MAQSFDFRASELGSVFCHQMVRKQGAAPYVEITLTQQERTISTNFFTEFLCLLSLHFRTLEIVFVSFIVIVGVTRSYKI